MQKKVRTRCLGPGKEHFFWSRDKVNERRCERCQEKVRHIYVLPVYHEAKENQR